MNKRNPEGDGNSHQPQRSIDDGDPAHTRPRMPPGTLRLKKGDRVEFEVGQGVDGPPYAMNVRFVDEDE